MQTPSSPFVCVSLSPIDLAHARLAISTTRAGGVGVLDAAHVSESRARQAQQNLRALVDDTARDAAPPIGIRLLASQTATLAPLLDILAERRHWLILAGWRAAELPALLATLAQPHREIWLECGSRAELDQVDGACAFAGWVARGAECGGWTGAESAFILTQHLARQSRPFLVSGGIGVHSAAACRVAGAAGVVIDDALLLMPESPLSARQKDRLGRLALTDTIVVGRELGMPMRVVDRPDLPAGRRLREQYDAFDVSTPGAHEAWRAIVQTLVGWSDEDRCAWPLGENSSAPALAAARYRTVGRLVGAIRRGVDEHIRMADTAAALRAGAPLAESHGTRYPIVQGPMTRVSDGVEFGANVAVAGALPFFALALMRAPEAAALLDAAHQRLQGHPWGVGLLGFAPAELRDEQLAIVERITPPFALISGGRPDQAARLEARGISTYLHVPAGVLELFLSQGATRLVFEGGECGGHVGPWHSFTLWDFAVDTLIARATGAPADRLHVLFAGGIHDARSSAMVAALAAPLSAAGIRIGVLMGTAYLFTAEAVESAAITPAFQGQALSSRSTRLLETGPGHVIRCAPTPFASTFVGERQSLRRSGLGGQALSDALEQLIVGRSRVASKGVARVGDRLMPVDERQQLADGLYMLGDAAALRDRPTTMAALHDEVSSAAQATLAAAVRAMRRPVPAPAPADVAIVGMSCLLPGARDIDEFWRNLLDQKNAITEIPRERWDWRLCFDPDPSARDRIYSRWGGFVDAMPFDPVGFGIPPKSLAAITIPQLIALELTRRALRDAGLGDTIADAEVRARTSVVFGAGNTADIEQLYITRATLPLVVPTVSRAMLDRLPEWTEESYPGLLANVVAGRVANRFDLGGLNVTVDAACASSLAALDLAVRELAERRSDLVIAGGMDFEQSPHAYMGFSRTRALSPRGRADVFDRGADGIVISEGGVVLVLKRLADAERDGDRVYAVIKAVAGSSDGKGLSLTAPKPKGQRLAIDRAYAAVGGDARALGLYEAHGTGTAVGDAAEVETIARALDDAGAPAGQCAIGSVKSLIGHTRCAAGLVGVLKAALALHHRVTPPHAGVTSPLPAFNTAASPLRLLSAPQPWLNEGTGPRRAGVSAFGFGGTNFHAVLEEHRDPAPAGAAVWPAEVFVVGDASDAQLISALQRLERGAAWLDARVQRGESAPFALRDLAYVCAVSASSAAPARVALIASTAAELRARIRDAIEQLTAGRVTAGTDVCVGAGAPDGRLAFLFPGQGSQFPGMGSELAQVSADVRQCLEAADAAFASLPHRLSRVMMPAAAFSDADAAAQRERLANTRMAQPAIGTLSCAMLDLARRMGLDATCVAGHSYGEFVALHAAGSLDRAALLSLSEVRGRAMSDVAEQGAMAMIGVHAAATAAYLAVAPTVTIANINAPDQIVISGPAAAVAAVCDAARADGKTVVPLNVSNAFHSPLMASARHTLHAALADTTVHAPACAVYANADGRPYGADASAIRARLTAHLEQPVNFVAAIETMYADGARVFVELGPGRVLTGLVKRILGDRPHVAVSADGGVRGWLRMVAQVFVAGHHVDVAALFADRRVTWVDLDRLPHTAGAPEWFIDGGHVWRHDASPHTVGVAPFLTLETAAAERTDSGVVAAPLSTGDPILDAYRTYDQTMRQFLNQQERMLNAVLGREGVAPVVMSAPTVPVAAPSPVTPATPDAGDNGGTFNREQFLTRLLGIVSDRTGYTADMLGLDLDLEADLGIDSIKRIEIIATLTGTLPTPVMTGIQSQIDQLSRKRSLNAIADVVMSAVDVAPAPAPAANASGACARFVMRAHAIPVTPAGAPTLAGLHLITADALGVAPLVAERLTRYGANAHVLAMDALADPARLAQTLTALRAQHGPVCGIVHAAPLGRSSDARVDAWRAEATFATRRLFQLVRACAADLDRAERPVVLVVTAMGGGWGRDGQSAIAADMAGGGHGIVRTIAREWPSVSGLVVDLDPSRPIAELADRISTEFTSTGSEAEVGYRADERHVWVPEAASLRGANPRQWQPQAGWTVLVTGGARGITAELCREVARPGVRLVLVGRSPLGAEGSTRPDDVERRRHMDALRALGAQIEYHAIDVREEAPFAALIADLQRRVGGIDAVIHGAGIIDDRRVESKTDDSFDRVFDTKVIGALTLARHLSPDHVKWVVFLGSISGRFGNPGQADYAAANETLNRIAWTLHRAWPTTRVVTINWGPWEGGGMASEGVKAFLVAQGIQLISPAAGREFFRQELSAGAVDDVEVVAGDGPWRAAASRLTAPSR